jgi:hypothetical protein
VKTHAIFRRNIRCQKRRKLKIEKDSSDIKIAVKATKFDEPVCPIKYIIIIFYSKKEEFILSFTAARNLERRKKRVLNHTRDHFE